MPRKGANIYKRKDNRWEGRYKLLFHSDRGFQYASPAFINMLREALNCMTPMEYHEFLSKAA